MRLQIGSFDLAPEMDGRIMRFSLPLGASGEGDVYLRAESVAKGADHTMASRPAPLSVQSIRLNGTQETITGPVLGTGWSAPRHGVREMEGQGRLIMAEHIYFIEIELSPPA